MYDWSRNVPEAFRTYEKSNVTDGAFRTYEKRQKRLIFTDLDLSHFIDLGPKNININYVFGQKIIRPPKRTPGFRMYTYANLL